MAETKGGCFSGMFKMFKKNKWDDGADFSEHGYFEQDLKDLPAAKAPPSGGRGVAGAAGGAMGEVSGGLQDSADPSGASTVASAIGNLGADKASTMDARELESFVDKLTDSPAQTADGA
eukprot:CAMPEP_0206250878 /NCGR_PEP_ID=MMETSP0047_2-20121206/21715_1 /ASSEMBLY_ACC=CAM_ASM_000192 /TAXON_ID=195065 /ORGANISM="Chroomonas mesostigmatica_cf, Strain CCMP1168" /LENGTH=118 /DNA_ID=CAMNT_0053676773 /DNA_START=51 /DNA_END=407 /DNA_ORIENTATION=-